MPRRTLWTQQRWRVGEVTSARDRAGDAPPHERARRSGVRFGNRWTLPRRVPWASCVRSLRTSPRLLTHWNSTGWKSVSARTVASACRAHSARVGSPRRPAACSNRGRGKLELEGEPRAPVRPGFDPQRRAHSVHEFATDREPEPRTGEIVARPSGWLAERLVQGRQHRGVDALARVPDRELEARGADRPSGDLDEAGLGELDGIGREVEEHPRHRAGVADTPLRNRMDQLDLEPLLFGEREHHPPHGIEDFDDGEGQGPALEQPVAPAGELEDVARGRAQTERCTINEPNWRR